MKQDYLISLTEAVTLRTPAANRAVFELPGGCREVAFEDVSPGLGQALAALSSGGATEDALAALVREADGADALARLYYCLLVLERHRALGFGVSCGGQRIATLVPSSPFFAFSPMPVYPRTRCILSRFAYLHRDRRDMVLESPLSHGKVILHRWEATAVLAELSAGQTLVSLEERLPHLPADVAGLFLEMLCAAGFVCEADGGDAAGGESPALLQWEFHDLLFHARSRLGRQDRPYGGTYRFHTRIAPPPVVKPFPAGKPVALYRPDIDALIREDVPFTLVLEERKSLRQYARTPVTARQIGEFLFRTARVKERYCRELQDLSRRPYPGAGSLHELEIYPIVHACEGIPPALYHYCPERHSLDKVRELANDAQALLWEARSAAGMEEMPQVLIVIAARFQRVSWKYESMAYSAILKDVGALFQTMYLVATAMDLAPCALGGGNSDVFARAAGLDYLTETSVGEFLVGSKRIG